MESPNRCQKALKTTREEYEMSDQQVPNQAEETAGAPTYEPPELTSIGSIEELTLTEDVTGDGPGSKSG